MLKFENHDNGRYYYLYVNRDLLNDLVLTTIRGGQHHRRVHHFGFNSKDAIIKEIDRITKVRLKHGYRMV
jgi:hypothetical protein